MIVRDEAAHLGACLTSIAGVCDEIVVVDTGSTDGSPAIARSVRCGHRIPPVGRRLLRRPQCRARSRHRLVGALHRRRRASRPGRSRRGPRRAPTRRRCDRPVGALPHPTGLLALPRVPVVAPPRRHPVPRPNPRDDGARPAPARSRGLGDPTDRRRAAHASGLRRRSDVEAPPPTCPCSSGRSRRHPSAATCGTISARSTASSATSPPRSTPGDAGSS